MLGQSIYTVNPFSDETENNDNIYFVQSISTIIVYNIHDRDWMDTKRGKVMSHRLYSKLYNLAHPYCICTTAHSVV